MGKYTGNEKTAESPARRDINVAGRRSFGRSADLSKNAR